MQGTNSVRGYSDFFASGFGAVTSRVSTSSRKARQNERTRPASSSSTSKGIFSEFASRRSRPTSVLVQPTASKPIEAPVTREKPSGGGRRTSFISFSSWRLFDRSSPSSSEQASFVSSKSSKRSSRISVGSGRDVWVSTGGPFTPSVPNGSSMPMPIDPFTSSPDARSMFIELSSDSSGSPTGTPKREQSFLSLTGSSKSNRSSFIFARRERPTSIHTMPLPARSRPSSFQYRPPAVTEKSDFFLIEEEEPATILASAILERTEEWDAPSKIDWRQFHIDILSDEDTTQ
ncbi:hypothetical protein D9619_005030 [Psilocybe cf. subviscida]|uniref:Uncharacterized protein n=1 Tax=Psilocybe cf. subviscida TaxID=2480587 RepID=A0A8H5BR99_9AGAR|nr:hypothetical protein D9619_005030 [Psilocybe cf. subviscida]